MRVRYRCRHCGEEVNPRHPWCCGSIDEVEEIPEEMLSLYERDLAVDIDGHPWSAEGEDS